MQALKSLVIGLGILVVIGMVVVVYGIIQKASDPNFTFFKTDKPAAAPVAAAGALAPFGDIPVDIGAGCRVEDARPDGSRLFVRVGPAGPCARVIVVDLASGRVLGNVRFREAP